MSYQEIHKDNVCDYVRSRTDFFAPDDELFVYEFGENEEEDGDGYVNYVYRVWNQDGKSLIVKQAKEELKKIKEVKKNPIKQERNLTEAAVMQIKHAIVPEYVPEVYDVDTENFAYICEDCKGLRILRFELMRGETFEKFPRQIAEFIAKTNFYTSEIYMDAVEHRNLQAAFMNPSMRLIFEIGLFLKEQSPWDDNGPRKVPDGTPQPLVSLSNYPWKDEEFRTQLLRLRQLHMKKAECLVHGDLHTSNILLDQDEMKIIDQEYTYMGLASCDTGYMMGSLLYEYIRWFYVPEPEEGHAQKMRDYVLWCMQEILENYIEIYCQCWDEDAKDIYHDRIQYRDQILKEFLHEVCGATGTQIISRIGGFVGLPDFDTIENEEDRINASRIAMWTAKYLVMNWEKCDSPAQLVQMVKKSVEASQRTLEVFGEDQVG